MRPHTPTPAARALPGPTARVERYETIVIGGGQAGLAVGHALASRDADFVILDREARVGDSWRQRWDSLRLFTPAEYSSLPGMPFPAPPSHLPDKDEAADYLERYAERFDLPVRHGREVDGVAWNGAHYEVSSNGARFEADNVVVATGPFQRPRIPVFPAMHDHIVQLHSSGYRGPFVLPDGPVLVVGAGNSGAQIAMELARFRRVWLAGETTGSLPRRVMGRDVYDWIWPMLTRFSVDTRVGRRIRERARRGDPLVGISELDIAAAGVERIGRVTGVAEGFPVCGDVSVEARVIIWCTGFSPDYRWIDLPVFDERGVPRHTRGVVTDAPGLFFVGLRFQHTMTSALLGGVGHDAEFIAERSVEHSAKRSVERSAKRSAKRSVQGPERPVVV